MVDKEDREHHAFFTGGSAADLLISMIPDISGSLLEPTAGDGELLKAYLKRAESEGERFSEAIENITAVEIQERHYETLKNRLEALQMAELPTGINPIEKAIEDQLIPQKQRPYLGYSQLGHECARYLWYSFRWCYAKSLSPRILRLFNRGHQEEEVVVADLKRAGVNCYNVLDRQEEVVGFMGHIMGHPDGMCSNVPGSEKTMHSLEIKTANAKSFIQFVRFGVERCNKKYWVQTQCYMKAQEVERCLYIITNKNDDQRFYDRIHYQPHVAEDAENRGIDIISSPVPLVKLSEKAEWYECKFCDAWGVCHGGETIQRNCRTCEHSSIHHKGEWHCSIYPEKPIPTDFQRTGCQDHYKPIL